MKAMVVVMMLLACRAAATAGDSPRIEAIPLFKQAAGTWDGTGTNLVLADKSKLIVTDTWTGEFGMDGTAFVQTGTVKLSSEVGYDYRWVYKIETKSGRIFALYKDSRDTQGVFLADLSADQNKLTMFPVDAGGKPTKAGMFSTISFKDGRLFFETEVRDREGKPQVQSSVTCAKQDNSRATRD
ncbi:MAG TPA: hypothetical protein VGG94_07540 [Chthoniobacterales bacterium]